MTAILLLTTTLFLCLATHGSGFDPNQSVQVAKNSPKGRNKINLKTSEQQSSRALRETQAIHSIPDETKFSSAFHQSNNTQDDTNFSGLFQTDSPGTMLVKHKAMSI